MSHFENYCGGADMSYQCLVAEKRTKSFIKAIKKTVKDGDVVLEAGCGTGILSIVAADSGAKKVYAIEQNKLLIPQLKKNIAKLGFGDVIEVIDCEATKVTIPEKVDVLICEMICGGLIDEPQIPVMNHLLKFLKKGGLVIPSSAEITIELSQVDNNFYGYELPYIHFEEGEGRKALPMSEFQPFVAINFNVKNKAKISKEMVFKVKQKGKVNSIRISVKTELIKGLVLGECEAYCPVVIIPVEEYLVQKGEMFKLQLSYVMGGGMLTVKQKLFKL